MIETELMRRRRATSDNPGGNSRVLRPPIPVEEGISYVAAPIVLDGAAIGFFHGAYVDRHVESLERDAVWAFADGFAQVFERAVLRRRVREQRRQLRELVAWTDAMAAELSEGAIELEVGGEPASAAVRPAALPAADADTSRLGELLTRRELDVLRLMARGDSNKAIAHGAGRLRGNREVPRQEHPAQAPRGQPGGGGVTLHAADGTMRALIPSEGEGIPLAREVPAGSAGVRLCPGR